MIIKTLTLNFSIFTDNIFLLFIFWISFRFTHTIRVLCNKTNSQFLLFLILNDDLGFAELLIGWQLLDHDGWIDVVLAHGILTSGLASTQH